MTFERGQLVTPKGGDLVEPGLQLEEWLGFELVNASARVVLLELFGDYAGTAQHP
jgi:hypothetical protein